MAKYQFETILTINADNQNDALYAYDQIRNSVWVEDSYCVEWNEVEN